MADKGKISTAVATSIGLGAIIGAGIFALSGTAIALAGAYALAAFVLVGVIALMVALESGELVSLMPYLKGSTYSYVYHAFGSELGFVTGIVSFFSYGTSISVISLSFGAYLASLLGISTDLYAIPFAILLILALSLINLLGARKTARADYGLVLIKVCILALFVAFAIFFVIHSGHFPAMNFSVTGQQGSLGSFFYASVIIFFAYGGFQTINNIVSVIKGGPNSAIKAILLSVIISIVLYVLVIFGLLLLLPGSSYTVNADPLTFALKTAGAPYWLFVAVGVGALVATATATITRILSGSRLLYQISEDGLLPSALRNFNREREVAVNGVILSAIIGIVMLFSGNVLVIAAIANFGMLFSYLMTSLVVIHFRRIGKRAEFRTPFYPYLPIIAIIAILAFMYGMPRESLMIGVVLVFSLLAVYYSLREVERKKVVRVRLFK